MSYIIPDVALDTHIGVLGRTGTGKTYTARGLVERLLDAKRQVIIIDPTSAWWGLRSVYPIPIFGGEHGDVDIIDASGAAVAETIITNRTSAIIDLSGLARQSHAAMRRFMTSLIGRLKDRERGALWLVIDEADEFMPQMLPPDMTTLFGDLKWIVRRGRIAGWRVMMITQRPQDIAKSVLTQIGTLVAHRLTAPQDRKAVEEWVKGHADPEEAKAVLSSLASLSRGEAWVWSPDCNLLVRDGMPAIRSFDSGATPDADSGTVEQPELTAIDLGAIRATLAPAEGSSPNGEKLAHSENAELQALRSRVEEVSAERSELVHELQQTSSALERATALLSRMRRLLHEVEAVGTGVEEKPPVHSRSKEPLRPDSSQERRPATLQSGSVVRPGPTHDTPAASTPELTRSAQKMVDALAKHYPRSLPIEHVAKIAGVSTSSSQWRENRRSFQSCPLVAQYGDLWRMTTRGVSEMGLAQQPDDPKALLDFWVRSLPPSTGKMLSVLVSQAPDVLPKEVIASMAEVSPTSSGLGGGLRELQVHGLIVAEKGGYRAAKVLL